jgi:hypothetical protein
MTWSHYGFALHKLGRNKEAIGKFKQVVKLLVLLTFTGFWTKENIPKDILQDDEDEDEDEVNA